MAAVVQQHGAIGNYDDTSPPKETNIVSESSAQQSASDTRNHQGVMTSPSTEQNTNGTTKTLAAANGVLPPSPAVGVKSISPGSEGATEFPFSSPPGVAGVSPTNVLMEHPIDMDPPLQDELADVATDLATAANGGLSRKQTREPGIATPRRSVQFARSGTFDPEKLPSETQGHSRQGSWGANEEHAPKVGDKERLGSQLMSKLKAITTSGGHGRSLSGWSIGNFGGDDKPTPVSAGQDGTGDSRFAGYDADVDAEESAAEGTGKSKTKRKRRFHREGDETPNTAPTTPQATFMPPFPRDTSDRTPPVSAPANRPFFMPRRATMNDIPEHQRAAISEDEGRDRMAGDGFFRRGNQWVSGHRGLTEINSRTLHNGVEQPEHKRPAGLRMLTSFGTRDADGSPSPWRARQERATSMGQQRWRQLKAGLKMLGTKKQDANRVETAKSAELMAELLAGAPAALIFASMFQRDERGHKRVPVLLEQLRVKITDSEKDHEENKHIFRIELEYGSSLARMKWVIKRDLQDFAKLHVKYKAEENVEKYRHPTRKSDRSKLPKFPRSAFPGFVGDYFSARGQKLDESDEEQEEHTAGEASGLDGEASGTDRPGKSNRRRRSSFQLTRKKSSRFGTSDSNAGTGLSSRRVETVAERQRRKLEEYLLKLITYVMFGRNSNRLCAFLELSALGVRLASEGYHGKEGPLSIRSTRGVDFKPLYKRSLKSLNQLAIRTSSSKWFLVRQSYLVCVDSLEEMNVYDVILVDPQFSVERKRTGKKRDESAKELAKRAGDAARHPTHHQLRIHNTERLWKLTGRSEHIAAQFEESIKFIKSQSEWAQPHRFGSFAPVRHNVWAQFLVDGRDYMWNVSRALDMARDVIYIHDWWLSPQLYMRRPAAISQRWRLDRILARKAAEGVKIYVIMYRNINTAIPIDSEFSKFSLLALNPEGKNNVFVQRSPNQIRQNTFFWAHHEKVCVVDHCVAFCGGVDLCFGRWDLPSHPVVDDKPTGFELDGSISRDVENCQLWPGKDYSNPRVQDFFRLDQPYEEMYDREKIPRMPWHDIGMQMVGQPARDLSRHFIQRWNFLLRQRTPSRPTPFLLPPTDFIPADLEALGLEGTCEIQILRSACSWSIGTMGPERDEHSIMNAYVDMIKNSEHFVYIENQFFITSCEVSGTKVENKIGDALVERIIRAHENDEWWRACIIIPLMPGFQNAVDAQDGSSVRIIMACQYRSICRGPTSIFARLRAHGIEPEDYIDFYALRSYGSIGPTKALVTEQLYIHAKVMIVDDRIAIIGSANINERSMLGSRDSEIAAIVRDKDMIPSRMAGEEYMVARFAHELRMRLMREHLGLDVDQIRDQELESAQVEHEMEHTNGKAKASGHRHNHNRGLSDEFDDEDAESVASLNSDRAVEQKLVNNRHRAQEELIAKQEHLHSFNYDVDWTQSNNPNIKPTKKRTQDARINKNEEFRKDLLGMGHDKMLQHDVNENDQEARNTTIINAHEVLISDILPEGRGTIASPDRNRNELLAQRVVHETMEREKDKPEQLPPPPTVRMSTYELGLPQVSQLPALPTSDDTDIGGPPLLRSSSAASSRILNPMLAEMRRPAVHQDCMTDPVIDTFFGDVWQTVAENNTKIFRQVFRCQPDNEVKTWQQYKEYTAFSARFAESQGLGKTPARAQQGSRGKSGPPGDTLTGPLAHVQAMVEKSAAGRPSKDNKDDTNEKGALPKGAVEEWTAEQEKKVERNEPIFTPPAHVEADHEEGVSAHDFHDSNGHGLGEDGSIDDAKDMNSESDIGRQRTITIAEPNIGKEERTTTPEKNQSGSMPESKGSQRRRRRTTVRSSHRPFHHEDADLLLPKKDAEELLKLVQGSLVLWPYDWLAEADEKGQFIYAVDALAPLEVYN